MDRFRTNFFHGTVGYGEEPTAWSIQLGECTVVRGTIAGGEVQVKLLPLFSIDRMRFETDSMMEELRERLQKLTATTVTVLQAEAGEVLKSAPLRAKANDSSHDK